VLRTTFLVVCGTVLAALAGASGVRAEQAQVLRVAVPALEADPALVSVAEEFGLRLREVADSRPGWRVTDPGILSVAEAKLTFACLGEDPACWAEVGRTLEADVLLIGSLRGVPAGLSVTLLLYDVPGARLMDKLTRTVSRARASEAFVEAARAFLVSDVAAEPSVLRITCEQDGAEVFVDNARLGSSPVPDAPVEAGRHEVMVRLAGHTPWHRVVRTGPGEVVDLRVALAVSPRPPPPPPPRESLPQPPGPDRPPSFRTYLGWGVLGGAAAVGGVGLLFGVLAQDAVDEFVQPHVVQRRAWELKDEGESHATAANVLFGVAAAMGVTGVVLLASAPDDGAEEAVCLPLVLPGGGSGLAVGGAF